MPKPLWLALVYLSAFTLAIDLVVTLPRGVFAAAFAFLTVTLYERFVWRKPDRIFYEIEQLAKQPNAELAA